VLAAPTIQPRRRIPASLLVSVDGSSTSAGDPRLRRHVSRRSAAGGFLFAIAE
jgi:hypothetical protein